MSKILELEANNTMGNKVIDQQKLRNKISKEMLILIPNNSLDEQEPECQVQQKGEAAGGREVTQGDT